MVGFVLGYIYRDIKPGVEWGLEMRDSIAKIIWDLFVFSSPLFFFSRRGGGVGVGGGGGVFGLHNTVLFLSPLGVPPVEK